MHAELVFVRWYTKQAVYHGGRLVYWGEGAGSWGLLLALGYACRNLTEIPTHRFAVEYDRGPSGHWEPPQELATLERQLADVKAREKAEEIKRLRSELARLEAA